MNNLSLVMDNHLLEENDFVGMLIHPLEPDHGMLVLNCKYDRLTLRIYSVHLNNSSEYHISKDLTRKTFDTPHEMNQFLEEFSEFKANQFTEFLLDCDNPIQ